MYSHAQRIRAVKLYIKLGKRRNATIRQLGYPTKNSLIGWYREYIQDQNLRSGYLRSEGKYSDEQKQIAVQHFLDNDRCIAATLKVLGYPCRRTLVAWIEELQPEIRKRIVGRAPNVQHPEALKHAAVIELCSRTTSALEIAQKLAVCRPTPCSRQSSGTGTPCSFCFKMPMIWLSVKRDCLIENSLR
jgi:putative transposase